MKRLNFNQKIFLTVLESSSVFLSVFLNQMIITIFPAYDSVKINSTNEVPVNKTMNLNCSITDSSNSYVAILIGCKYSTELLMMPIVGMILDKFHPPLILFAGLLIETLACLLYITTGNFYVTIVARIFDGCGYAIVSTSGLTLIYSLYLKDRPRNRIITIDSILVYIASSVGPFLAGYTYESLLRRSEAISRLSTFMLVGPLLLILAVLLVPFAFENSSMFSKWLYSTEENEDKSEQLEVLRTKGTIFVGCEKEEECKDESNEEVHVKTQISVLVLLKDKHIILILLMLTFISLTGNSLESTLPIFMIRKFCSDQQEQGIVWLFGMMSLLGFALATSVFHVKQSVSWFLPMIGIICDCFLCVSLPFCPSWQLIGLVLGSMCFVASMSDVILIPMIPMIIDKKYPNSGYGSGSGLTMITFTISGLLGTFPVGPLVDRFGFLALCIILSALNLCLAPFVPCLRPYFR